MPYGGTAHSQRGDPFIHRRAFATIKGFATGGIFGAATGFLGGGRRDRALAQAPPGGFPGAGGGRPGKRAAAAGVLGAKPKRKRMNFGNTKALTRASRRIDGFVKVAKRALKHTNYKLVTKQSASRRSVAARHHRGR